MTTASPERAPRTFETIGVVGLGTMGAGIAEVFARNGFGVVGVELNDEAVERGRQHLEHSTGRAVARGKITEAEQAELLGRITFTTDLTDLADADFVVEAVVESLETKKDDLPPSSTAIVSPDAILATNTSSLSVTEISTANAHPGRVVGVHFFNPAPVQNLVEIVRTVVTEPDVLADVEALVEQLGKNPVVCGDKAGFIANTLLFGYLNHAVAMFEGTYATREDIDAAMRFGCGYPMGPLALLDLIGLDTAYEILETMYRQGRDRLHAPGADPQADGHRRAARPQDRPRLLHLRGRRQLRRSSPTRSPRRPTTSRSCATTSSRSASSAPARWRPASSRSSPRAGTTSCTSAARRPRSTASAPPSRSRSTRRSSAASSRSRPRPRSWTGSPAPPRSTTCKDVDIVVEAIAEDLHVKTTLFENLDEICKDGAILATTTSSLPIIACAQATARPQDVIGMHFFNPAPVMKLVEVVSTVSTDEEVAETTRALCAKVGKVAVSCADRAGFIVNALLFPYLNDAVKMLQAHYATADDIDTAMKQGCALPMGPVRAARRGRQRRLTGDPARALPRVPRARLRARAAAGAPGHRGLPRPQDPARLPRLQQELNLSRRQEAP